MGTHPIFESDFDCLTVFRMSECESGIFISSAWMSNSGTIHGPCVDLDIGYGINSGTISAGDAIISVLNAAVPSPWAYLVFIIVGLIRYFEDNPFNIINALYLAYEFASQYVSMLE